MTLVVSAPLSAAAGKAGWRSCALTIFAALLWSPALAEVVSARPDNVAITIYRDQQVATSDLIDMDASDEHGLALIVETRTIDLPAGPSRVRFLGVADGIIPESAAVVGLPVPIQERNFDYDLLSPGALVAAMVGEKVRVFRTNPVSGKVSEDMAVIRSGPEGVVLDFQSRIEALRCSGGLERLVFDHVPSTLAEQPTLSVNVDVPTAGRFTVQVSYLTVRLDWSADYVARISRDGKTLDLTGWITIANRSGQSFAKAPTSVVAGNLRREEVNLPEPTDHTLTPACWSLQTTHSNWFRPAPAPPPSPMEDRAYPMAAGTTIEEVVVTSQRQAVESELGDYKLYTLAEPTTVAARQAKQVSFLQQEGVPFETIYRYTTDAAWPREPKPTATAIVLRMQNRKGQELGRSLPAGGVSLRQIFMDQEQFISEARLDRDIPLNEPFELATGEASNVTVTPTIVQSSDNNDVSPGRHHREYRFLISNAKATEAAVEIRQVRRGENFRVSGESQGHGLKSGDPLWRIVMPANSERALKYSVDYRE